MLGSFIMIFVGILISIIGVEVPLPRDGQIMCLVLGGMTTIIATLCTIATAVSDYTEQLKRIETINELRETKNIEKREIAAYMEEAKDYLTKVYPDIEKDIIGSLNSDPKGLLALANAYPDLKSNQTIQKYVSQLISSTQKYYEYDKKIATCKRSIRVEMKKNVILKNMFLPKVPDHIGIQNIITKDI